MTIEEQQTVWLVEERVGYRSTCPMKAFRNKEKAENYTKKSDKEFYIKEIKFQ